jgi:phosphate transport system substrate-binding protein
MKNHSIVVAAALVSLLFTSHHVDAAVECGPSGESISIAGSSTVFPLAEKWAKEYMAVCPSINITVEAGGSSTGASRVCASDKNGGTPVDIADMSRNWFDKEGLAMPNGYVYQCVVGEDNRSVIRVDVAIDGISIATLNNGTAANCIQLLGGLTVDQLRWIFSTYSPDELLATGWDSGSITNSDDNQDTHLWSELDARCEAVEIIISGPYPESGTFDFFLEHVLIDLSHGETFDSTRPNGYFTSTNYSEIVRYTEVNGAAISFFAYAYYLKDSALLYAVPIQNDEGNYVIPSPTTISDGTYNPFSRRLYMNMVNDVVSLDNTRPFLQFALGDSGTDFVDDVGCCVPIDASERQISLELLPGPGESVFVSPLPSPTTVVKTLSSPTSLFAIAPSSYETGSSRSDGGRILSQQQVHQVIPVLVATLLILAAVI